MRNLLIRFARSAGSYAPDATVMAALMLLALMALALGLGNTLTETFDGFYRGLWMLLTFTMQMVLMLLLSTALAATPTFRKVVPWLASLPRSTAGVMTACTLLTCALSYFFWGLGLALGPLIAVQFARSAEARGIRVDFPCLLATQFAAFSSWQFGLSSSPALLVATPGHFLESTTGVLPFATTIWSLPAIVLSIAFPLGLTALSLLLMPRVVEPLSHFPAASALVTEAGHSNEQATAPSGFAAWSERTRLLPLLLALIVGTWLYHHFVTKGAGVDLNAMVTLLLLIVLLLQPSLVVFADSLRNSIGACWQVIVLYPLYGGVAGLLQYTSVGGVLAEFFARFATPLTFPLLTAIAGAVVAFFVPSSGGQWTIQGFITARAATAVGTTPQLGLLSLGVGDQMGNLISPFWVVVCASIAQIDFRKILGFVLVYSLLWFGLGVAVFTFVPAGS